MSKGPGIIEYSHGLRLVLRGSLQVRKNVLEKWGDSN